MRGRTGSAVAARVATLGVLLCLLASGPAAAERRVLLAFDEGGHRVHRVSDDGADGPDLTSRRRGKAVAIDPTLAAAAGDAVLLWRAADGRLLAIDRAPDPRLGHAPAGGGGEGGGTVTPGGRVVLAEGAWQVRGPDAARSLELRLPARGEPSLAAERWRLPLEAAPAR